MELNDLIKFEEENMLKALEAFKKELSALRTGRPNPELLYPIKVDAYGAKTPISQLANITIQDAKTLLVSVWDKALVSNIDAAIREANLGFNPVVDGTILKIYLPPLTEERRNELVKLAGKYAENFRIELRKIRREALEKLKSLKKDSGISEDDIRSTENKIQKITDNNIKSIDSLLENKVKELQIV